MINIICHLSIKTSEYGPTFSNVRLADHWVNHLKCKYYQVLEKKMAISASQALKNTNTTTEKTREVIPSIQILLQANLNFIHYLKIYFISHITNIFIYSACTFIYINLDKPIQGELPSFRTSTHKPKPGWVTFPRPEMTVAMVTVSRYLLLPVTVTGLSSKSLFHSSGAFLLPFSPTLAAHTWSNSSYMA